MAPAQSGVLRGQRPEHKGRVLEIDFFRGAAILVIFWNHFVLLTQSVLAGNSIPLRIHYGFSDSSATFIFLSGLISGYVYQGYFEAGGFLLALRKAVKRGVEIYVAQAATLIALLLFGAFWADEGSLHPLRLQFIDFLKDPVRNFVGLLSLQSCLDYVDILPFYIIVVPLVPLFLWGFRVHPGVVLGASFCLYLAVQIGNSFGVDTLPPDWFVNPFTWQLLFVLATFLGYRWRRHQLGIPKSRWLAAGSLVFVVISFFNLQGVQAVFHLTEYARRTGFFLLAPLPWTGKTLLEPLVLVHFFALSYLVWIITPKLKGVIDHRMARPIVICGQHALFIYAFATILDYVLSIEATRMTGALPLIIALGISGWLLILALSVALRAVSLRWTSLRNSPPRLHHRS